MKLNIVIKVNEESFRIINGYPLIYRLIKNIEENINLSSVKVVYRPLIYLQFDDLSILEKHQAYINTIKNVLINVKDKPENSDYTLFLSSNIIYLDHNWLYNLLNFANKKRSYKLRLCNRTDVVNPTFCTKDYLVSYDIGRDREYWYHINDILQ